MYILIAILIFGFLIFIHELGHFLTAKALDVQVNEFSICMGPAIVKKQRGETLYALRCIPVGGYCAMEGEDEESDNPRAFTSKVWWKRLIILAAGSFMNFLTGLVVLAILYSCVSGFSTAKISGFFDGCELQSEQGLQLGDELYKIDGRRVYIYSDVSTLLSRNKTGSYDLVVKRDGKLVELQDFAMQQKLYDVDGVQQYKYGLYFGYEEKTVGTVLKNTWYTALDFARLAWMSLGDLLSGLVSVNDMSGRRGVRHRPDRRVRRDHGGRHSERALSRGVHRGQSGRHEHAAPAGAGRRPRVFAAGEHGVHRDHEKENSLQV